MITIQYKAYTTKVVTAVSSDKHDSTVIGIHYDSGLKSTTFILWKSGLKNMEVTNKGVKYHNIKKVLSNAVMHIIVSW